MKVLLTGALGNVGEYTAGALLREGHEVVALELESPVARKASSRLDRRIRLHFGDVADATSVRAALQDVDAAIHLAGMVPPHVERNPERARRVNVGGTLNLIREMEATTRARRLVFASSIGVFGHIQDRQPPLRADTPVSPTDEYGRQKVACEEAIRKSKLDWTILRLGAAVPTRILGTHYDPRAGFEISPNARIEFIHPGDAGIGFARAVGCDEAFGKTMYLGGGKRCQMFAKAFYDDLMGGLGIGPIPPEAFVHSEIPRFTGDWMDTEDSERLLRYQTRGIEELKVDMRKGLRGLVPLIQLFRPIATWYYVRSSPYLRENRRRAMR